ncbi:MAG: dienelactone hydrolase family protein [Acidimicrobiia bacterium]
MGELAMFANGQGYLALPEHGARRGPGVVVIQEWWGLNEQIRGVCDRLARHGFVALAPDLYRGIMAREPDDAAKLMMELNLDHAAADMRGAVEYLTQHPDVEGAGVGVMGFCMGGGLALWLAALHPDHLLACVPFYGVLPWPSAHPDWSQVRARIQGHYGELDTSPTPAQARAFEQELRGYGVDAEFYLYPDAGHAFANEMRPDVYHAQHATTAMERAETFLRETLRNATTTVE